jgi:hypothetical protein
MGTARTVVANAWLALVASTTTTSPNGLHTPSLATDDPACPVEQIAGSLSAAAIGHSLRLGLPRDRTTLRLPDFERNF